MNLVDRQALKDWESFHASHARALSIDDTETGEAKTLRIRHIEADPERWFKYYFPQYYSCEPAPFQINATTRIVKHNRWLEVRAWSRELSKSTRAMMEYLYLALAKKKIYNVLMISNSEDNAIRLLLPFRISLEKNRRIINDYGNQKNIGTWESYEFITRSGVSFRAVGAGQSPRGTRFENRRVDGIIFDDIDTDEECRNERIVKDKFKWMHEAVIPTVSVSGDYRILVLGNVIAKICCVSLAMKIARHVEIVNIRDENGKSTWSQKNKEEDIDQILSFLSYASAQKEYYNNPISEGSVFKDMAYRPVRQLNDYRYLVCYTDPSFKDSKKNDFKATVLIGRWHDEFHIIKAFVEQTSTAKMIDWHYQIDEHVRDRVPVYYYMEANFIQDTLLREFYAEGSRRGKVIPIKGDERKKADKFTRIESLLEPLNRNGKLFLNAAEKDNKQMQRLEEQFIAIEPGSKAHDDGPDAVEGAVFILNNKMISGSGQMTVMPHKKNPKRL